jgi:phospholipid/cholesterol/gamma-HCH transport system substrate-binding protein
MRRRDPVVTGAAGVLVLALVVVGAFFADALPLPGGTTYSADFREAAGLREGDEVRLAGLKIGEVRSVALRGDHVQVGFRVHDVRLRDRSRAEIRIKTLLGQKYLAVDSEGDAELDPDDPIPTERTLSPYDVVQAFEGLSTTLGRIDTAQLATSFDVLSQTFENSPENVRATLAGLSALSRTISSRDERLAALLGSTRRISGALAARAEQFETLLADGNLLLAEVRDRREAVAALLTGTRDLSTHLSGLVEENTAALRPALDRLGAVADVLQRNQDDLDRGLRLAAPYYRLVGGVVGSGPWVDSWICGLVPVPQQRRDCDPAVLRGGR